MPQSEPSSRLGSGAPTGALAGGHDEVDTRVKIEGAGVEQEVVQARVLTVDAIGAQDRVPACPIADRAAGLRRLGCSRGDGAAGRGSGSCPWSVVISPLSLVRRVRFQSKDNGQLTTDN